MSTYGLVGFGAFGREVFPYVDDNLRRVDQQDSKVSIVVEDEYLTDTRSQNSRGSHAIIGLSEFLQLTEGEKFYSIAIADISARVRLDKLLLEVGAKPLSLHARTSVVYDDAYVSRGAILCHNSVISSQTQVGHSFHLGFGSYLAHDCQVGNYVTVGPQSTICGYVELQDFVQIGAGVVIKPGRRDLPLTVGEGSIIGAGAVVTKDVAPRTTIVGNPAREIT